MVNEDKKTNILLFGLGAIGSFYAFILSRNQNVSLSVIARSNYDAVKQNGLEIKSAIHGEHTVKIDHVLRSPSEASTKFDYIVLAHKSINPGSIPPLFREVGDDRTTFVIIQNGVGNEDPFHTLYPNNAIVSCVTWTGAIQNSPGVIEHNSNEDMQIGLFPTPTSSSDPRQARLDRFAELLRNGGTKFNFEADVQIKRWEKVVWNAAWNPLTTLTGAPVQDFLNATPEALVMTKQLMQEVISVAQRCGVPLKEGLAEELIDKVMAMQTPIFSSMYQDAKEGRPLEVDVILGTPMRRAKELGMEDKVPVLRAIYAMTMAVNGRLSR
ncbi:Oxidoreductase AFT12-1 [Fulvia fulva]|nr:Oxidoreductase AFT12-1 [Fulvia fulva]